MEDPLKYLDEGLERDAQDMLSEALEYWMSELRRFDAGEQVIDLVSQVPMTREEIVQTIDICKKEN